MSNNNVFSAVPVSAAPSGVPVESAEASVTAKRTALVYRLLAIIPLALCVAILLLGISVFQADWSIIKQSVALKSVKAMIDSKEKAFGFLPALFAVGDDKYTLVATLLVYVLLLGVLVSVVLSIIALITGKSCLVRSALAFVTWGALVYGLGVYCVSSVKSTKAIIDIISLAIAAAGLIATFILVYMQKGKSAWLWLLFTVLAIAAAVVALFGVMDCKKFIGDVKALVCLILAVGLAINAIVTFCRSSMGIIRGLIHVILALVILLFALLLGVKASKVFAAIALGIAILLFILILLTRPRDKEPEEPENPEFIREEFIEAYAYTGGPVAGIELAEEVNPTVAAINAKNNPDLAAQATVAKLLGNGFDPFLITLSEKEKEDFIDLYVLKCKGMMPEIPGYVVGGDNKDFFNKVFIYLGQHREKIPAELLNKMYEYSMKI